MIAERVHFLAAQYEDRARQLRARASRWAAILTFQAPALIEAAELAEDIARNVRAIIGQPSAAQYRRCQP